MSHPKKTLRETIDEAWDDVVEHLCGHLLIEPEQADQALRLILACAVAVIWGVVAFVAMWVLTGKPVLLLLMPLLLAALAVLAGRSRDNP